MVSCKIWSLLYIGIILSAYCIEFQGTSPSSNDDIPGIDFTRKALQTVKSHNFSSITELVKLLHNSSTVSKNGLKSLDNVSSLSSATTVIRGGKHHGTQLKSQDSTSIPNVPIANALLEQSLPRAIIELENLINLIYQRYEFKNEVWAQSFLVAANMQNNAWDLLKSKFAIKILSTMTATGAGLGPGQLNSVRSKFLMLFGGSSVTAGHDNYFNQSYPLVFERRMKKAFEAAGINLVVHNIAQGANHYTVSTSIPNTNSVSNPI